MQSELNLGVGWQDPSVIQETGLCVWKRCGGSTGVLYRQGGHIHRIVLYNAKVPEHIPPLLPCSGRVPELDFKSGGSMLEGRMAIAWTGEAHVTYEQVWESVADCVTQGPLHVREASMHAPMTRNGSGATGFHLISVPSL